MPPVFGGAPTCPTCNDKVYFAEQTLGPGGRAFHKICLKCVSCGKLLEPRLLVDHDGQAYCKACHGKSFGTKGYGAGGALVGEYQPRLSPSRPTSTTTASGNSPAASPARASAPVFASTASTSRPPLPPKPSFNKFAGASPAVSASQPTPNAPMNPPLPSRPSFGLQPQTAPDAAEPEALSERKTTLPVSAPTPTAARSTPAFSDDEDDGSPAPSVRRPLPFPPSQFAPKSLSSSGDLCRRCGTQVYFAEQVIAVGSKWHKRCLRCAACSTTLNSHLLEKDRLPYCKKCYQENFGTGSLGITSVPPPPSNKRTPLSTFRLPANPHPSSSASPSRSSPTTPSSTPRIVHYTSQHFVEFEPFVPSPPTRASTLPSAPPPHQYLGVPPFMSSSSSVMESDGGFDHFERDGSTLSDATYDGYSASYDCPTSEPYYSSTPVRSYDFQPESSLGKRSWVEEQHEGEAAYDYTPSQPPSKRFRVEPITPVTPSSSYTYHADYSATPSSSSTYPVSRTLSYGADVLPVPPLLRSNTYSGRIESQRPSSSRSSFSQNDAYPAGYDEVVYGEPEFAYAHSGASSPGTESTPFLTCTTAQTSYFENTPCDDYPQTPALLASPLLVPQSAPIERGHFQPYPDLESASMSLSYSLPHPAQQYDLTPRRGRTIHSKREEAELLSSPTTPRRNQVQDNPHFQLHSPISPQHGNSAPALVPIPSASATASPTVLSRRSSTGSNYTPNQAALVSAASMNRLLSRCQPLSPTKGTPLNGHVDGLTAVRGVSAIHPKYRAPPPPRTTTPSSKTTEKIHTCIQEGCGRRFKRLEHLKRHERTHTLEKPYGCDIPGCGRYFSRSDNLAQHRKTHDRNGKTSRAMAAAAAARETAARAAAEATLAQSEY
ncbi:hypothetical protein JCM11491_006875 [Sporobolomyces phaffii]